MNDESTMVTPTIKHNHLFKLSLISFAILAAHQTVYAEENLDQITVTEEADTNATAGSKSYTIKKMSTATGLKISGKDTPQSVSVITKKQLDDKAINTLEEAMRNATGVNVVRDSGLQTRFLSRGFYVDQIGEDGITTNVAGRSGYTAKIDTSPSTDLAIYDHIEVVRGATGLTQSNSEPGGTINLVRKRPTDKFQHLGEISVDQRGSVRTMLDVSGKLNTENTARGRVVGVAEKSKSFKDRVHGKKGVIYGVTEMNVKDAGLFTIGGMYQKIDEVPDYAGVILPCENPRVAPYTVEAACNNPYTFPRSTYLGADWSKLKGDKYNIFGSFKYVFDNDWTLNVEGSYTRNKSDAKIGQFFLKNEHTAGISSERANGFLTEKGEVIPFEPKKDAVKKLKEYASEAEKEYIAKRDDFVNHHIDNKDFELYKSTRAEKRAKEFQNCVNEGTASFICGWSWAPLSDETYKDEYVDMKLKEQGISNDAESRFGVIPYSSNNNLYNQAISKREHQNYKYDYNTLRHKKDDKQYGIKLDLTGTYELFGRTHDLFIGYSYNKENISSSFWDIFDRNYQVDPNDRTFWHSLKRCIPRDSSLSPISFNGAGMLQPEWDKYDSAGSHELYRAECEGAMRVLRDKDTGLPISKKDANGKPLLDPERLKLNQRDDNSYTNQEIFENAEKEPLPYYFARYNYAEYLNTNVTHAITISTRFNATDKLHLLGGIHYTHFDTMQSKNLLVFDGEPLSKFQSAASAQEDKDHYTSRMKSHRFTPYAGITYDITDNQSVYASYTQIFKQQDNVDVTSKTVLPPLIGTNYEIGWKGSFFDGRFNSSIALFTLEQKNRTVVNAGWINSSSGVHYQTYAEPIGKVESKGIEIELAGDITENWQLFLGYTYNKSKYKNAEEVNAKRIVADKNTDLYTFSNFTPVQMFRLGTSYRIPHTNLTIGASVSAQTDTTSLYGIKQSGYTLVDGFVQYAFNKHAKLSVIGTNLTDKVYFENNYNRSRGLNNFYGRPRTFMMKFDWEF